MCACHVSLSYDVSSLLHPNNHTRCRGRVAPRARTLLDHLEDFTDVANSFTHLLANSMQFLSLFTWWDVLRRDCGTQNETVVKLCLICLILKSILIYMFIWRIPKHIFVFIKTWSRWQKSPFVQSNKWRVFVWCGFDLFRARATCSDLTVMLSE